MSDYRCHSYRGTHIPGCWGCVVYSHEQCTCPPRGDTRVPAEVDEQLQELRHRVEQLERAGRPA